MSYFTILISNKENISEIKQELFSIRQKSLSFVEDNKILNDTKSFKDIKKYSVIYIESYFSCFLEGELSAYEKREYGENRLYLEQAFKKFSQKYLIAFGFFFDDRNFKNFQEKKIKHFPKEYEEGMLYILK
jgi:hypothetical protein